MLNLILTKFLLNIFIKIGGYEVINQNLIIITNNFKKVNKIWYLI